MRTCVGCRRRARPSELVRVVRLASGELAVGRSLPGRGAWMCAGSLACLDRARRGPVLSRALRGSVEPEALDRLRARMEDAKSATMGRQQRRED